MYWDASSENIQRCLIFLDKDQSGTIEFDEFLRWGLYAWQNQVLKPDTGTPGVADVGLSPQMRASSLLKRPTSCPPEFNREGSLLGEINTGSQILESVNESLNFAPREIAITRRKSTGSLPNNEAATVVTLRNEFDVLRESSITSDRKLKNIWKKAFDSIDTDGSGEIDCTKLESLFDAMYWDATPENIQCCLKYLDKDRNGTIVFDDFLNWGTYSWKNKVLRPGQSPCVTDLGISPRLEAERLLKRKRSMPELKRERSITLQRVDTSSIIREVKTEELNKLTSRGDCSDDEDASSSCGCRKSFITIFDNVRYVISTIITLLCICFIIYAIASGWAHLPGHPIILYVLFVFTLILLAYLEGLQVAIIDLKDTKPETFQHMKRAFATHKLATAQKGLNVQRFLIGRQFFVIFIVFLCGQITTYSRMQRGHIPDWLYILVLQTGFPGVLVVLSFGQLMPQLIAATHPITFLNLPGTWCVLKLCLAFETVGVTHFSWILTYLIQFCCMAGIFKDNIKGGNSITPFSAEDSILGKMNVDIVNLETLSALGCNGARDSLDQDIRSPKTRRFIENNFHHTFKVMNSMGIKKKSHLPSQEELLRHFIENNNPVPRYLLPPNHPEHIPPHLVVIEFTRRLHSRLESKENINTSSDADTPPIDLHLGISTPNKSVPFGTLAV